MEKGEWEFSSSLVTPLAITFAGLLLASVSSGRAYDLNLSGGRGRSSSVRVRTECGSSSVQVQFACGHGSGWRSVGGFKFTLEFGESSVFLAPNPPIYISRKVVKHLETFRGRAGGVGAVQNPFKTWRLVEEVAPIWLQGGFKLPCNPYPTAGIGRSDWCCPGSHPPDT